MKVNYFADNSYYNFIINKIGASKIPNLTYLKVAKLIESNDIMKLYDWFKDDMFSILRTVIQIEDVKRCEHWENVNDFLDDLSEVGCKKYAEQLVKISTILCLWAYEKYGNDSLKIGDVIQCINIEDGKKGQYQIKEVEYRFVTVFPIGCPLQEWLIPRKTEDKIPLVQVWKT